MTDYQSPVEPNGSHVLRDSDDVSSNPTSNRPLADVVSARLSRRSVLKGIAAGTVAAGGGMVQTLFGSTAMAGSRDLTFPELPHVLDEHQHVADGYSAEVVIRWGDPVLPGAPAFDVSAQSAEKQKTQFGYNNDFIAFMPLSAGSANSHHGLLCVNQEYTDAHMMFPGGPEPEELTREQVMIEMAAHGHTVVEIINYAGGQWQVVPDSVFNRRITASDTVCQLTGPAAGHHRLKTSQDPTGTRVIGTLNNCAGGTTPWGTVLFAEENFNGYFGGDPSVTPEARNHARYGIEGEPWYAWHKFDARFNVERERNEPNRFGYMVEFDPYDPRSTPKKRTALGRFKHEGGHVVLNKDGRAVVYMGDDQRFDYVYKFVSAAQFNQASRAANLNLLDSGTLFVGRFDDDGSLSWLPLRHGHGPLTATNGFHSQADIIIETRRAADLLGATPMDRPEDIEPSPITGSVFVMLTNNTKRRADQVDAANPRAANKHGHIIEMIPPGGQGTAADHAATEFRWDVLLLAGNPASAEDGAQYHADISKDGWLSTPDNCAFDRSGNLWIATDGAPKSGIADGLWVCKTEGAERALTRHFYATPVGAECCGPCFTPDDTTLFVAVQHPGDIKGATFDNPGTRWPDYQADMPPRPAVVAIRHKKGLPVGV